MRGRLGALFAALALNLPFCSAKVYNLTLNDDNSLVSYSPSTPATAWLNQDGVNATSTSEVISGNVHVSNYYGASASLVFVGSAIYLCVFRSPRTYSPSYSSGGPAFGTASIALDGMSVAAVSSYIAPPAGSSLLLWSATNLSLGVQHEVVISNQRYISPNYIALDAFVIETDDSYPFPGIGTAVTASYPLPVDWATPGAPWPTNDSSGGLRTGEIGGIAVGGVAALAVAMLAGCLWNRRQRKRQRDEEAWSSTDRPAICHHPSHGKPDEDDLEECIGVPYTSTPAGTPMSEVSNGALLRRPTIDEAPASPMPAQTPAAEITPFPLPSSSRPALSLAASQHTPASSSHASPLEKVPESDLASGFIALRRPSETEKKALEDESQNEDAPPEYTR